LNILFHFLKPKGASMKAEVRHSFFLILPFLILLLSVKPAPVFAQTCIDGDGDGYGLNGDATCPNAGVDCDDTNNNVYPGAPLKCDALDNNCDGYKDYLTDEDKDGDGVPWCAGDCNDNDPLRFPGNQEGPYLDATCSDGIDNDCDNKVDSADSQCKNICTDVDGDGYGNPGHSSCTNGGATDCNDNNVAINPGATDTSCNGVDNNCSGTADDGYVPTPTSCGVGECAASGQLECQSGVEVDTCVAGTPVAESPIGFPVCSDGLDNDCDGTTDGADLGCAPCTDNDGDGYGSNNDPSCQFSGVDCNDDDAAINPGGDDVNCNGVDEDCIGGADSGYVVTPTNCGIGACASSGQIECQSGAEVDTCVILPAGTEGPFPGPTCSDGIDNDCDGLTDGVDSDCSSLDSDDDGDGYTENQGDCDDTNNTVYPGAPLICDGLDNNCDGYKDYLTDEDKDGDGVPWCSGDCNDNNPLRYPGNQEGPFGDATCSDGIDNDCDNKIDAADSQCQNICTDVDGDGYGNPGHSSCTNGSATDCNDNNAAINPGATDANCDGVDGNCSGTADDQYVPSPTNCGVGECAASGQVECQSGVEVDTCAAGTPVAESPVGSPECGDGLDNDCDGLIDQVPGIEDPGCAACTDNDGDGYGSNGDITCANGTEIDCNDNDATINPGASDANCDGVDGNCSGTADDQYVPSPTNCGVGACTNSGQVECQSGEEVDTCAPFAAGTEGPYPGPTCGDGIDNDCDGLTDGADSDCSSLDVDDDGDGYTENQGDCDDTRNTVYPGAPPICDGLDSNCDGFKDFLTDEDKDGDGVPWCAGDCNDNNPLMYPGNQEGPRGDATCSDGIDNDCDNNVDITDSACAPPSCNTKFTPQDGPHIFDLLDPVDDSVIASSCNWCHSDALLGTGTTEQRLECQRCHADPGDTSDPLNGVLKDPFNPNAYPASPPYGFGTAPDVKLHSSSVVGNKYGNWDMHCLTCHNPHKQEQDNLHGTSYGKYVREYICFDNPVTGLNIEEVVEFTADTGLGSFADGPPHNENICEMCHTQTKYHRNDGTTDTHNDGSKCTDCHLHSDGFLPVAKSPHNTAFFNANCQLCHVENGGIINFTAKIPDANCQRCHGERKSHTSDLTRNKFASGNYNYDFMCVDCHDPMVFVGNNRKLLRETIAASVIPGSIVSNTTRIGVGSLADGPPRNENICETCHFFTSHNRGDGSGDGVHADSVNYDGSYCMLCHDHNTSFMLPGTGAEE
jgi:hypothetical protein